MNRFHSPSERKENDTQLCGTHLALFGFRGRRRGPDVFFFFVIGIGVAVAVGRRRRRANVVAVAAAVTCGCFCSSVGMRWRGADIVVSVGHLGRSDGAVSSTQREKRCLHQ